MTKTAVAVISLLTIGLAVCLVLLVQSSRQTNSLEARITGLEQERNALQTRLQPFEAKQRASMRINQEFVIEAGKIQTYRFSPALVPGTLSGTWRSSGEGFGGADDTIAAFRFTDPKDTVLDSAAKGSSGRFLVKLSAPGAYTFFFDNSGLLRSTPRRVFLEAEFKPE